MAEEESLSGNWSSWWYPGASGRLKGARLGWVGLELPRWRGGVIVVNTYVDI